MCYGTGLLVYQMFGVLLGITKEAWTCLKRVNKARHTSTNWGNGEWLANGVGFPSGVMEMFWI